ncbi:MAG: bifunctional diaminohydroxyphosphoribosylaminopyrimidine deaminase/5-amino-6-(5-phosphoribosylamino)uracil reductase RibD [Nitrospira sp.]|nr:bifunctional diaminohydroxyphosphoribosylaminopyrimidine deaminase/5-amino-6-(5-phosphoribosylamino)uracil reductase RibD [Nitrospira sp.]
MTKSIDLRGPVRKKRERSSDAPAPRARPGKARDSLAAYMRLALNLAARGRGRTSPNPMVGAVLVSRGRIIGRGYHGGPGTPHAEVVALQLAGDKASGATLYTNLEPCCHIPKRTPPCTKTIIQHRVRKVVIAMRDPNPQVRGRGLRELKKAGVLVQEGILGQEAIRLNEAYVKYMTQKCPFVILKVAQSLDGKIATAGGESRWMTSEQSRIYIHRLRAQVDGVMVGVGTLLRDNPRLTARTGAKQPRQPLRIVVDSTLRTPLDAQVIQQPTPGKTLIATTSQAPQARIRELEKRGVKVLVAKERQGRVDLADLMRLLGEMAVMTLMIEGGSELNASAIRQGIVDKVLFFITPRIIGGQDAKSSIGGVSPRHLSASIPIQDCQIKRIGPDLLLEGYMINS